MLGRNSYEPEELETARSTVKKQLADWRASGAGGDLEATYFNSAVLALDRVFVHRVRTFTGKDTNPLNEVELLAESLMSNGGRLDAGTVVKYRPEASVLGLAPGDEIRLERGRLRAARDGLPRRGREAQRRLELARSAASGQPPDDVRGDIVAVGLVEDLVPRIGVDLHRHVLYPGVAVALPQQLHERSVPRTAGRTDRRRPGEGGLPGWPRAPRGRPGRVACANICGIASSGTSKPHSGSATYASTSASSRESHSYPVRCSKPALNASRPTGPSASARLPAEHVERGRPGEHDAGVLLGVVQQHRLRGEGTHGVRDQEEREVGRAEPGAVRREIVDQSLEARRPEVPELTARSRIARARDDRPRERGSQLR